MKTHEKNKSLINLYGQNLPCIFKFIDTKEFDGLRKVVTPDFTNQCITQENPIVVKEGGVYRLLNPYQKIIQAVIAGKIGSLYCAELVEISDGDTLTLTLLLETTPATPILVKPTKSVRRIQFHEDSLDYLRRSYMPQLNKNAGTPALLSKVFGAGALCEKSVSNNNPSKPISKRQHIKNIWNEMAKRHGGFSYQEILSITPDEKKADFPESIRAYLEHGALEDFFDEIQSWAKKKTGGINHG